VLPVLWVVLPRRWPGRGLAWLAFAGLLALRPLPPAPGCIELTLLDVGQGLAVAGRTARHVLLYDTGPAYRSGGTAADRYILPFLANRGIRRIDRLVISHSDLDHAGGAAAIVRALPVLYVESGDSLALPNRAVGRCRAGDRWNWDGIRFTFLHPPANSRRARNDASCVLLVEAGEWRVLLAGDIEAPVETELVQARVLPKVEVTTVPHHGSRSSSTVPYLRSLTPRYALVSAAHYNQWGMPKEDVVERWRNVGATVLTTGRDGAIRVELCAAAEKSTVRAYRVDERRPWHRVDETHGVIGNGF
jgi:competence protein ComEC